MAHLACIFLPGVAWVKRMVVTASKESPLFRALIIPLHTGSDHPPSLTPEAAMSVGFLVGVFGCSLLAHAAYATVQYRGMLKIVEEEFSGPPYSVYGELIVGFFLCVWAALTVPGKFLSILPYSEENRIVSLPANLDFMIFNHRGKAFPSITNMNLK